MLICNELAKLVSLDNNYLKFTLKYPIAEINKWEYSPVRLNFQVTKRCNQRCISCNSFNYENKNELSVQEINNCIDQVTDIFEIKNIAFTGGEALLIKGIHTCFQHAKHRSKNVSLTTNGQLITCADHAETLITSGINNVTLSYHGIGVHDKFTGIKGAEKTILDTISYLKSASNSLNMPLRIKIGTLITEWTCDQVEQFIDLCEKKDMELFIELPDLQLPIFKNTLLESILLKRKSDVNKLVDKLTSLIKLNKPLILSAENIPFIAKYLSNEKIESPCPVGFFDIYIDSIGNVYTGCWVLPPIGNIRVDNISNIINSKLRVERLHQMQNRKCPGCSCGYMMMSKYYLPYVIESL